MKNVKIEERERITCYVRDELQNFTRMASGSDIKPTNVQRRSSEDVLYRKYLLVNDVVDDETSNSRGHSSRTSVSDEPKTDSLSEKISSVSGSEDEKLEILVRPDDVQLIEQRVYNGPGQKGSKPTTTVSSFPVIQPISQINSSKHSILKPMHQRLIEESDANGICVVRPEIGLTKKVEQPKLKQQTKQPPPPPLPEQQQPAQPLPINLFRMRLSAALCKAKDEQQTFQKRIQTESPETVSPPPVTQTLTIKCNSTPISSSQSSNNGSPTSIEIESLSQGEIDPSEMEQEKFLRLFDLCTPAQTAYLMNRRPQRKKRVCTSTERMDYYYGKFELFEKQFSKRNSKRHFLYSPPATRAKRRIASNGINSLAKDVITAAATKRTKGIKSNASSSSSISSNGSNPTEKVCLTCYKRSECSNFIKCLYKKKFNQNTNNLFHFISFYFFFFFAVIADNLLQCQKCCGQYHAACHVSAIDVPTRKIYCPICVRQQKSSINNFKQNN